MLYNDIENAHKLPKLVRQGAILYTDINNDEGIEFIKKVIGDDLLTMEEKDKLINRINETKNNKRIIQEWMVEDNNRLREANILNTAIEDGIEQGIELGAESKELEVIKKMLNKNTDYEYISEITGKSIDEIKEIHSNLTEI